MAADTVLVLGAVIVVALLVGYIGLKVVDALDVQPSCVLAGCLWLILLAGLLWLVTR